MPRLVFGFVFILLCFFPLNAKKRAEKMPIWISQPSILYSEEEYIVELGSGLSQKEAENKAIENLASIFNRSVSSKTNSFFNYNENANGVDKTKTVEEHISVLTSIKNLIGVQIKERWKSKEGVFYALAVLNKQKSILIYSEKVNNCASLISEALEIPSDEKGTFQEYSRYVFANSKLQEMSLYNAYLAVLNPISSMLNEEDKAGLLELTALSIAKNILIEVKLNGNGGDERIKSLFEKVFTSRGFNIAKGSEARYLLNINLEVGEITKLSDDRLMVRYSLASELLDSITKKSFLPFVFSDKAVHFDSDGLKNQIFKNVQKKVEKDFDALFNKYMEKNTLEQKN
ncbi:MAG: LPP20 family lipoprotein [Treponema sp.]